MHDCNLDHFNGEYLKPSKIPFYSALFWFNCFLPRLAVCDSVSSFPSIKPPLTALFTLSITPILNLSHPCLMFILCQRTPCDRPIK